MGAPEEKQDLAGELFDHGLHKILPEHDEAWKSACFAARLETHGTATSCAETLKAAYPGETGALPYIPDAPVAGGTVDMSVYGLAFVYIKVSSRMSNMHLFHSSDSTGSRANLVPFD